MTPRNNLKPILLSRLSSEALLHRFIRQHLHHRIHGLMVGTWGVFEAAGASVLPSACTSRFSSVVEYGQGSHRRNDPDGMSAAAIGEKKITIAMTVSY